MSEHQHELELRLRKVACALDADAPAFDPTALRAAARRRVRQRWVVALAVLAALAAGIAAPTAVSALGGLFDVDEVPELGPVPSDVAPGYGGRQAQLDEAQTTVAFSLRTIPSSASRKRLSCGTTSSVAWSPSRIATASGSRSGRSPT